jgi:Protein of unknown function (DUF1549)/Planctomycete cytochrome C
MNLGYPILLAAFAIIASFGSTLAAESSTSNSAGMSFFEQKIRPVLADRCYKCHSMKAVKLKGGLALDSKERALKGGNTGPAIVPSKPEESLLLTAIRHADPDLEMPPEEEKLPAEVIANFEKWIKAGAPYPESVEQANELKPWWDLIAPLRPAGQPVAEVVDHYLATKLQEAGVPPVGAASDANFIRRLTLDLAGRIPTTVEVQDYESSSEPDKKRQLVDRLLASPAFVRQQVTELDWMLMDGKGGAFRDYLTRAAKENRGWDTIFRDVIAADATNNDTKGAEQFLKARIKDQDRLANDVSTRFLGVNISCAQCHDHPLVPSWKQDHYFGMKSFFNRTFEHGDFLGERDYGQVSFKPKRGDTKRASLMFITGQVLNEPDAAEPDDEETSGRIQEEERAAARAEVQPARAARRSGAEARRERLFRARHRESGLGPFLWPRPRHARGPDARTKQAEPPGTARMAGA